MDCLLDRWDGMCKISIIMPVYNKENYIEKCIKSIIGQSFTDWELIIINDGSTDFTLEICQQFSDARIKIISVENSGVSKARNLGLSKAEGEYITFVDGDDYLDSDYLKCLFKPQYDMSMCGLTKVKKNGEVIKKIFPINDGEKNTDEVFKYFYREQMDSGIYGFVAGKMVKRSLLEENKIRFNPYITLAEDYDFFLKVYDKLNKLCYVHSAGYFYLQDIENIDNCLDDSKIDFFTQIEIQNNAKKMLLKKNAFGIEEETLYLRRITNYVYTILLLSKDMDYNRFSERINQLKKIAPKISVEAKGLIKCFMKLYAKDNKVVLFILIKLRKLWGKIR